MHEVPFGDMPELEIVSLEDFASEDEPGADPFVGDAEDVLGPQGGDWMFYGVGGGGKTTVAVDLAFHLAAGDDWHGIPIAAPRRVLVIENEGPRPFFRRKVKRKAGGWQGSPLEGRIVVLESPWARVRLDEEPMRASLAHALRSREIDVVVIGPVTSSGMNEAGTLQQTRDFMALVAHVRELAGRPVMFVLVHHQNRGGSVSGAWEGVVDTLVHVQPKDGDRTRLYVEKARWASRFHRKTMTLAWGEGESFVIEAEDEITDETMAEEMLAAARENAGASWTTIRTHVRGNATEAAGVRDLLIREGKLVNTATREGHFKLWVAEDPASRSEPERVWNGSGSTAPVRGDEPYRSTVPTLVGTGLGTERHDGTRASVKPPSLTDAVGACQRHPDTPAPWCLECQATVA